MKAYLNTLSLALLLASAAPYALAQDAPAPEGSEFHFTLQTEGDRAQLTCERGCAWTDLSFALPVGGDAQPINEYGMTAAPSSEAGHGRFLIEITRTEQGALLTCEVGCAWTELTFGCERGECAQGVDALGMSAGE